LNDTFAEQVEPAATPFAPAQLSVSGKSAAFGPEMATLTETVPLPAFDMLNCFAALDVPALCVEKVHASGNTWTTGAATDVPLRATVCGLAAALSVKLTAATFAPVVCGEKATPTVQVAPETTVALPMGQGMTPAETIRKSAAFDPVMPIPVRLNAAVPVLWSEIICKPLEVPATSLPKFREAGEVVSAAGSVAFAESNKTCVAPGTPPELSTKSISAWNSPGAADENVTLKVQEPEAGTDASAAQVFAGNVASN
jgi:hypothetical protein